MAFTTNDDPEYNLNNGTYRFVEHMGDIAFHVIGNTLPQVYEQTLRAMFSYMCPTAKDDIMSSVNATAKSQQVAQISTNAADSKETNEGMDPPQLSAGDNDEGVAPSLRISDDAALIGSTEGVVKRMLDVKGGSLELLLFSLMNETLYLFHTTRFVPCFSVKVPVIEVGDFKSHTAAIGYKESRSDVQSFRLRCVMEGGLWYPPTVNERGVRGTEIKAITKEGLSIDVHEEDGMWHGHSIVDI